MEHETVIDIEKLHWLSAALRVAGGERSKSYGRPLANFLRTALRWSMLLKHTITPADVAWMMVDLKIARQINSHQDDNIVDDFGYLICLNNLDIQMKELGYSKGVLAFEGMSRTEMQHILEQLETEYGE